MKHLLLIVVLTACENTTTLPVPYIIRVTPSFWELNHPEEKLFVTGHSFLRGVRVDLEQDADPTSTGSFSATLGGLTADVTWVSNRLLEVTPPLDLGADSHTLTITTPLDHRAHLTDAVRISPEPELPRLTVNTIADENDIQGTPLPGTEGQWLSLREAILIANFLTAETYAIRFDTTVFPRSAPGIIEIGAELLPAIRHPGVVIDGSGAGVEISGVSAGPGPGLTIRADDVVLRNITVRDFANNHCVDVEQADQVLLRNNTFLRCDEETRGIGAQVIFHSGQGHRVIDNRFLDGGRDGVTFASDAADCQIEHNEISRNGDDGLTLYGRGHVAYNNDILNNLGNGIEVGSSQDNVIIDNRIRDNGDGVHGVDGSQEHGIELFSQTRNWQIIDNELTRNHTAGIHLGDLVDGVSVSRCQFIDNVTPILGGRHGPPTIDSFDGINLSGTSSAPGTIEVYSVEANTYRFVTTTPSNGSWDLTLHAPFAAVAATLTIDSTNDNGDTSEMSAVATP